MSFLPTPLGVIGPLHLRVPRLRHRPPWRGRHRYTRCSICGFRVGEDDPASRVRTGPAHAECAVVHFLLEGAGREGAAAERARALGAVAEDVGPERRLALLALLVDQQTRHGT